MSELSQRVELLQEIDYSHAGIGPDSIKYFKVSKSKDVRHDNDFNLDLVSRLKLPDINQIEKQIEDNCRFLSLEKSIYSCVESDLIPIMIFGKYKKHLEDDKSSAIQGGAGIEH